MGYEYGYVDYGSESLDLLGGILGGFFVFFVIIFLIAFVIGILQLIAFWKIYKKAGKGGWEAIIPFYCNWVLVEIAELNWWWFLAFFAPVVSSFIGLSWLGYLVYLFATFTVYYNISKKFNKGVGFAICFTLFTPICAMILGFSKNCVYNKDVKVSNNGLIKSTNNNNNNQNMNYQQPQNNGQVNNFQQPVEPVIPVQQPASPQIQSTNCSKCGAQVKTGDRFCMNCGNQL